MLIKQSLHNSLPGFLFRFRLSHEEELLTAMHFFWKKTESEISHRLLTDRLKPIYRADKVFADTACHEISKNGMRSTEF